MKIPYPITPPPDRANPLITIALYAVSAAISASFITILYTIFRK